MTAKRKTRHLVGLEKRSTVPDGYGNTEAAFVEQFEAFATYTHLRGGESVLAERLAGNHVVAAEIRTSAAARQVTTGWRFKDKQTGTIYNITDVTQSEDRRFITLLCKSGQPS